MLASLFDHVQPLELARRALATDAGHFAAEFRDAQLLLIELPEANGPLAVGLHSIAGDARTAVQPAVHPLGYKTVLHAGPLNKNGTGATGPEQTQTHLLRRLRRALHFIVPLRKRTTVQSAFQRRISVGRATNQDISLRDPSISKSHAWFELDEDGGFHVADAGSTNGTKIDGIAIEARATHPVDAGQVITFGSIEALLCDAQTLWQVFDSARREWPSLPR